VSFWQTVLLLLIFIPLLMVWGFALIDIFRRDDLSGGWKAIWLVAVIVLPLLGTLVYLLTRPPGATPAERQAMGIANREVAQQSAPRSPADQLSVLADLHDRGKLTDAEFAAEKAKVLGGTGETGSPPPAPATA
jgi:hypothetical protein